MAQPQGRSRPTRDVGFNNVELFKDQTLGIGSYGAVCIAKCDDLLCAAKILHPTLFNPTAHQHIAPHREHRLPFSRFQQECEFMSVIRHPNIVQYLGVSQDPETHLSVLLMELMDDSLTNFLESSQEPLPYHTQLNFCHDIAQALSFLHSNAIIHRDLSSNNVLLIGDVRAKVTDFGMAKLGDISPQATCISLTMCPGTDAYMPPEAVKENPVHTVKIDSFSFGVLVVQILTRQFPKPGDRHKTMQIDHPQFPSGTFDVRVSEIERRQNHISQVDPNHPLKAIALDCLKDKEMNRPSAQELCIRIAALKESPQYNNSVKIARERNTSDKDCRAEREEQIREQLRQKNESIVAKEREIQQLRLQHSQQTLDLQQLLELQNNHLEKKEQIMLDKEQEIGQLQQQLDQTVRERDRLVQDISDVQQQINKQGEDIAELNLQIQKKDRQLETSEQVMAQFQTRIQELETQLSRRDHQSPSDSAEVVTKPQQTLNNPTQTHGSGAGARVEYKETIKWIWRNTKKAPCKISRSTDAVVSGNMVYFLQGGTKHIHAYNSTEDTWSQLPDYFTQYCTLAIVNNLLTTIGGYRYQGGGPTNQLFSLTGDGHHRKWTEVFPPMPTKRKLTVALCSGTALIVAGGHTGKFISTVEVLNIDTLQWSTAADLPDSLCQGSATICGDRIYMLGGLSGSGTPTKSVYTCSVSALLQSTQATSLVAHVTEKSLSLSEYVWSEAAKLPVAQSTCVTLYGRLLAIGGGDSDLNSYTAVYLYNSTTNTWKIVSCMKITRRLCLAAVLSSNKLMVVGGLTTSHGSVTDHIEIATVV